MVDIKKWQDRIENLLQVQKDLCLEQISTTFTRNELIELRLLFNEMIEIANRAGAVTPAESEEDMNRNNASRRINDIMKKCNVKQYEVADYLGIRESNFSRDLRYYMTPNRQKEIIDAIKKILEIKDSYKELSNLEQIIQEWKKEYIDEIIVERDIMNEEFDKLIQQVNEL